MPGRNCSQRPYAIVLLIGFGFWPISTHATTLTFQEGVGEYTGTVDTVLKEAAPTSSQGALAVAEWDGEDLGGENHGLLRFDNIFGTDPGQIAPTDTITSMGALSVSTANLLLSFSSVISPMATPATGFLMGTPASISDRVLPQTLAMEVLPLELMHSETSRMA